MKKKMIMLAFLFLASTTALALPDTNRLVGDDWDDGRLANWPATFVQSPDRAFRDHDGITVAPYWPKWPIVNGVLDLSYFQTDLVSGDPPTNISGRMWWLPSQGGAGRPYQSSIDTTAMTTVYLVVRFKVDITSLASDGTIGLVMELATSSYGDLSYTVFRVPVTNGGDYVTVIVNLKDQNDPDPNTLQGQGGDITWPTDVAVVPSSLGYFAFRFGDFNGGSEVIQPGDFLSVDFLALTTNYTPYLPQVETGADTITASSINGYVEEGMVLTLTAPEGSYYQWYFNGEAVVDAPDRLVGANEQVLTFNPVLMGDAGVYTCRYDDGSKAIVETPEYTLEVLPPDSLPVVGVVGLALLAGLASLGGMAITRKRK